MKYLFILSIMTFSAWAQNSSPVLDPNKYTVCTITINSNDEKKIFEAQTKKYSSKFNPVVELTDFNGGQDWFKKSCESGIKCDQLVISGHFAGDFFSEDGTKSLKLKELEEASCNKSCEGVLKNPLEVFLFGCNTLSNKDEDSRTPAQYLQVLLQDGISLDRAEMIVESRYGTIGDSNRGSMQRIFAGDKKQIYGFNSIGPSGKTIKGFLNNYFTKVKAPERIELVESKRLMETVDLTNKALASSLKSTAFTQCPAGDQNDTVTKNICALQDDKISVEKRLDLIHELLGQENYLGYLPAINSFFDKHSPTGYSETEKKELALITDNKIIKEQIIGLIKNTKSIALKSEWSSFASTLSYITPEDRQSIIKNSITDVFSPKLSDQNAEILCSIDTKILSGITFSLDDFKNKDFGPNEISALNCMNISSSSIVNHVADRVKFQTDPWTIFDASVIIKNNMSSIESVDPASLQKIKTLIQSSDKTMVGGSLEVLAYYTPNDPQLNSKLQELITSPIEDNKQLALDAYNSMEKIDQKNFKFISQALKTTKDPYTARIAIDFYLLKDVTDPEAISALKTALTGNVVDQYDKRRIEEYLATIK